ncbi:GNAT family N-acetyltransferase [Kitasatospora kazusensis]|uniref:GNAT family N-acetyltransferase n=1 Tax=Kitasatospora kazusensis TaxID=407974 RepID=A0ABN2YZU3_9ACTN
MQDRTVLSGGVRPGPAGEPAAVVLRPWGLADTDPDVVLEAYRDRELRHWLKSSMETRADALRWLEEQRRGRDSGERISFAVVEGDGGPVGHVVLKGLTPGGPSAEVGYWTVAAARGRGVASRAVAELTRWAFEAFGADGLVRLELFHQVGNEGSCRVAERSGYGFVRELPPLGPSSGPGHLHVRSRPEASVRG